MCDIESYIYMPLLEETNYVPTMKYASGTELREHAERIAQKWALDQVTWFRHRVDTIEYDDKKQDWVTCLIPQHLNGNNGTPIKVRSRFAILATGFVMIPQVPQIKGIEKFEGPCFHTARWNYDITGGTFQNPEMDKLKDQKVGIIGTGATAIQAVPALVPWAKELYVFQRTPSAVDRRDNRPTDSSWAREITSKPGWQKERSVNFHHFVVSHPDRPSVDMVSDGWTRMDSYYAFAGTPKVEVRTPEDVQKYVETLHKLDLPRQDAIRTRIVDTVHDPITAKKLQPWYPSWCKRPCFHDEYLPSFNQPNVHLVDTDGQGVTEITKDSLKVGDKEYKIDTLILSTGYRSPVLYSPAGRVGLDVKGRNGCSLDKKWNDGVKTLHGVTSYDFPNFFWPGLNQASGTPNFTFAIDCSATHVAKIMAHAAKLSHAVQEVAAPGGYRHNFTVEPTPEAEEDWAQRIVSKSGTLAANSGCTPSYFNGQGEMDREVPAEVLARRARSAVWGKGALDFLDVIEDWRSNGYQGLRVVAIG